MKKLLIGAVLAVTGVLGTAVSTYADIPQLPPCGVAAYIGDPLVSFHCDEMTVNGQHFNAIYIDGNTRP